MTHNSFLQSGLYSQMNGGAFREEKPSNPAAVGVTGLLVLITLIALGNLIISAI